MSETEAAFTICVPSYNRGQKALALVNDILPRLGEGCRLAVIDNASHADCAGYEAIARMAAESGGRLEYCRNTHNLGFHGNYVNSLHYSDRRLTMLVSDEDRPNLAIVGIALALIAKNPKIGIVRGGVAPLDPGQPRRNSFTLKDAVLTAGKAALMGFGLGNNYFSGTVYNMDRLAGCDFLDRLEKSLVVHRDYPHLYLEGLIAATGDIAICSEIACFEGPPQMISGSGNPWLFQPPYTVGCRMDQFISLRNTIYEAVGMISEPFDAGLFGDLYLKHCAKFFRMVAKANGQMYANNFIDVGVTIRSFAYFACAALVRIPECEPYKDAMLQEIDRLAREFGG